MTSTPSNLPSWAGLVVAATIMIVFVITSFATLKERHRDRQAWHVHAGAAIYGAMFGVLIGFFIMPLRVALMSGELPSEVAGPSAFGVLVLVIAMRMGWIARAPFIGPQVRAYRRANLRRSIESAKRQLEKLSAKDQKHFVQHAPNSEN